ncbi:hypothetical protein XmelCFBP4644_03595 [Xanthomonas melonis]|uniref:Uncharacterized protein n=1 Tax=Xanthomonas melonis TaxID=56456 RepID=A0A2S7DMJ4_9XANT|nr:hypothetical protein XmelCFBP4644_03595 [Xanthomonas melonis]
MFGALCGAARAKGPDLRMTWFAVFFAGAPNGTSERMPMAAHTVAPANTDALPCSERVSRFRQTAPRGT